jgi:aspartyl-tRNA(Asn)/glutamyl-tRNA(Gln) amidotransferase subunit A
VEPDVRAVLEAGLSVWQRLEATVQPVTIEGLEEARAANFVTLNAEHYATHEPWLRSRWHQHGRSARLYLVQAGFLTASDYVRAREVGRLVGRSVDESLRAVDALILPTSPVIGTAAARQPAAHRRGVNASFTAPFNLTGHPALSVPGGLSATGLPVGLHIVGRRHDEATLLRIAYALERATPWHTMRPPLRYPIG